MSTQSYQLHSKAYVGTGLSGALEQNDLWEYNILLNTWLARAPFPASGRRDAVAFDLAGKGYLGLGFTTTGSTYNTDIWEYNTSTNSWTAKTPISTASSGRSEAYYFEAGGNLYVGSGISVSATYINSFLKFEPNDCVSPAFTQNYDTVGISNTINFSNYSAAATSYVWKADGIAFATTAAASHAFTSPGNHTVTLVASNSSCTDSISRIVTVDPGGWSVKAEFAGGERILAAGFSIGTRSYVGSGADGTNLYSDFWSWNSLSNTWTQIADLPGPKRKGASGFSIGGDGYIALGSFSSTVYYNDLWKYDTLSNTWSAKANFPGAPRANAADFVTNGKAYVCTGKNTTSFSDHYMYDPLLDSWTAKANYPTSTYGATGIAAGNLGYVGLYSGTSSWYQYNPATNAWLVRAPCPTLLGGAKAFVLNDSRIYVGNNPCYAYCPYNDKWIPRKPCAGGSYDFVPYTIGNRGYNVTGADGTSNIVSNYEYNPNNCGVSAGIYASVSIAAVGAPVFLQKLNHISPAYTYTWQDNGTTFMITTGPSTGSFSYTFGTVGDHEIKLIVSNGTCSDTATQTISVVPAGEWQPKASLPAIGLTRNGASTFSIGTNMYMGCGVSSTGITYLKDFWKYDQTTDTWTQKANVPGPTRSEAIAFSINDKGYLGTGRTFGGPYTYNKDFYEYDTLLNTWTAKTDLPSSREGGIAFSIAGKGYAGTGEVLSGTPKNDFYEYDPVTNVWTAMANIPKAKSHATCFVSNGCGIVSGGKLTNDSWRYSPTTNSWQRISDLPYEDQAGVAFSINDKGYVWGGQTGNWAHGSVGTHAVFFEFNDSLQRWVSQTPVPVSEYRFAPTAGGIGNYGYAGMGAGASTRRDLWQYNPNAGITIASPVPVANVTLFPNDTACSGSPIYLNATPYGGAVYQWFLNGTPVSGSGSVFYPTVSGNYSVSITTSSGVATSASVSIVFISTPTPTISQLGTTLSSSSASTYQWYLNGNPIAGATLQNYTVTASGSYTVVTTSFGCPATSAPFIVSLTDVGSFADNEGVQVYPNPIRDKLTVSFSLQTAENLTVKIYGVQGNLISTADHGLIQSGEVVLDISGQVPNDLNVGIYFIEINIGKTRHIKKLIKS